MHARGRWLALALALATPPTLATAETPSSRAMEAPSGASTRTPSSVSTQTPLISSMQASSSASTQTSSRPAGAARDATQQAAPARSVGWPWAGRLVRGNFLKPSSQIRHLPSYAADRNFYGTGELVALLEQSASAVARRWPGSRLSVGELSARRGGRIDRHHSHRNGRDADVAFFMRDARQVFARFDSFLAFGRRAPLPESPRNLRFDDERNWELLRQWLSAPNARIQYVFVSNPVRNRLLVEGRRRGANDALLQKAAAILIQPRRGDEHADHFHVRLYCAQSDRPRCKDGEPYWPWYEGKPPGDAYTALPTLHWRPTGS